MHYEDIELACVQCGEKFTFSKSEQQHWAKRGFVHKPKRCKKCRDERRARMQNFYGSSGNQGIYRAPSFRNERNYKNEYRSPMAGSWKHQPREYNITCSKCGAKDTIPFKPAPGREIFCHACYEEIKKSGFRKKRSRPASRGTEQERPVQEPPVQESPVQEPALEEAVPGEQPGREAGDQVTEESAAHEQPGQVEEQESSADPTIPVQDDGNEERQ